MTNKKVTQFIVMGKFTNASKFIFEKQFVNRHSADTYVQLMNENKEYEDYEYFLFEQSHAYNLEDR